MENLRARYPAIGKAACEKCHILNQIQTIASNRLFKVPCIHNLDHVIVVWIPITTYDVS